MKRNLQEIERERRRGWIINFLSESAPKPLEISSLIYLLDAINFPMTSRTLARELLFLRNAGLIKIADRDLTQAEATKFLHRYAELGDAAGDGLELSITNRGIDFQEKRLNVEGVMRIN